MSILTKSSIRNDMRTMRKSVNRTTQIAAAEQSATHLTQHAVFQQSQSIAVYLPTKHELDCMPLIQAIWSAKKTCFLPVLLDQQMQFSAFQPDTNLLPNQFGILQPTDTERIAVMDLDLIIAPLLAFDLHGNRLGMGGGYYDRTLAFLLNSVCTKPHFFGYAYAFQQVDKLPHDAWDVRLQGVVTEKGILLFM